VRRSFAKAPAFVKKTVDEAGILVKDLEFHDDAMFGKEKCRREGRKKRND
jgi:hypothetical protein